MRQGLYILKDGTYTGCISSYEESDIKYVVDGWKNAQAPQASEAGLIMWDDFPELGYELQSKNDTDSTLVYKKTEYTPSWVYNSSYKYWTMTPYNDSTSFVWYVISDSLNEDGTVSYYYPVVRPVITISKSEL